MITSEALSLLIIACETVLMDGSALGAYEGARQSVSFLTYVTLGGVLEMNLQAVGGDVVADLLFIVVQAV